METIRVLLLLCCVIAIAYSLPANNDVLDKATANDVAANELAPSVVKLENDATTDNNKEVGTATAPEDDTFKPQKGPSVFARLIDDIFNIPISVLQSVARLLRNPFKQPATPENTSKY